MRSCQEVIQFPICFGGTVQCKVLGVQRQILLESANEGFPSSLSKG